MCIYFFLIVYWRFDEGKGIGTENIASNNISGLIEFRNGVPPTDDFWIPVEDGDPVELEDKWGKRCPPQFAIHLRQDLTSIKTSKKNWFVGP